MANGRMSNSELSDSIKIILNIVLNNIIKLL